MKARLGGLQQFIVYGPQKDALIGMGHLEMAKQELED